uniref:Putative IS110 transposase n=1 Tax=Streptomyces ambofaciens (strain ATCC 23877 / 3486 / DSM 40053 / JCM 4204 / NBRC 12836 / NRRL B-2516) TaxID=278992 RepID=A0ADA3_STRA7|nr:putative IS110 transposase [Streptomyces ambofaciens ATCC 23877]
MDARERLPTLRPARIDTCGGTVISIDGVGVFLGLDVGKQTHHGHGLTPAGKKVFDKQLPNSEPKLRAVFDKLTAKFGTVLVIVDQPASIGALPLTVARDAGCQVAYLPGLAMRRIADLYPGEAKTDAKDAAVIADAARTMPHTLRTLDLTDEVTAELTMLVGFDQDLAGEANRTSNRIRGLLTQFHPSLERVLGPRLDHPAVTWLLERYGSPQALRKAGRRKLVEVVRPRAPRMAERLVDDTFTALDEQTVVVPGTGTLDVIVPSLAKSLAAVHEQRRALETRIEALLEAHPLSQVLTSMPGIGVRTAAVLLATVGDGSSFPTAAHLASYAGLAPVTRQSGTSIHGEHAPRGGNRQLKRAMFLSAFAALHDPASRTYYDRCRARGKTHTQALLRLARHRISVLFALLRDGTFYEPRSPRLA